MRKLILLAALCGGCLNAEEERSDCNAWLGYDEDGLVGHKREYRNYPADPETAAIEVMADVQADRPDPRWEVTCVSAQDSGGALVGE